MARGLALVVVAVTVLVSCGSTTTTTTITKTAPSSTTATTPTASTTTSTTSTASTTPTTLTTSTTAASSVYFQGAVGTPVQRPSSLQLTADGTLTVNSVQWTAWGGPAATGSGNAEYHGCTPSCAQAPVSSALVSIRLFGIRACSGRDYYSGVNLILNSGQLLDRQFLQRSWSPC